MKIAILMANTDISDFSDQHPKDGEKFTSLIHLIRADWSCQVFDVTHGQFPENPSDFDGFIITGSPASVHDDKAWISQLSSLVQQLYAQKTPLFGACFGHQVIAKSLGGHVGPNPKGWVLGVASSTVVKSEDWMGDLPKQFPLHAAHTEQVLSLPEGAEIINTTENCPIAGYAMGKSIFTTQYHPEMTPEFIAALVEHLSDKLDPSVVQAAKASLEQTVDIQIYAALIVRFFEQFTQE